MKKREIDFILECLKYYHDKDYFIEETQKNEIDMDYIEKISQKNKIWPIICSMLSGKAYTDQENIEQISNLRMNKIEDLLLCFEKNNIKYSILKGNYLSEISYGRMDVRSANDIDLLIKTEDVSKIKKICKDYGWEPGKVNRNKWIIIPYSREQQIAFRLNTHQIATMAKICSNKEIGNYDCILDFNLKLTWGDYIGKKINIAQVLDEVKKIEDTYNHSYYVLKDEWYLIQLCLHLFKESNDLFFIYSNKGLFLRGFCDVYYYILNRKDNISMNKLLQIIFNYEITPYIYYVFWYIEKLFGGISWISDLLSELEKSNDNKLLVNGFGLNDEFRFWKEVDIYERFFLEDIPLKEFFSQEEIEIIELKKEKFY